MQIEFNTSRLAKGDTAKPVAPQASTTNAAATDSASFASTQSLDSQLSDVSTVRPDKVAAAKALLADPGYPPDEVLKGISNLLAIKIQG